MTRPAEHHETKICTTCHTEQPLSEFRPRRSGDDHRHNQCRTCFNAYHRRRRRRRLDRGKELDEFHRVVKNPRTSPCTVSVLCGAIIKRFGGLNAFLAEWKRQVDILLATRPGRKAVFDFFSAVLRLALTANEERKAPGLSDLTDEELQQEFDRAVEEAMCDRLADLVERGKIVLVSK